MDRRAFVGTVVGGLLAAPLGAKAQQGAERAPRIGYVSTSLSASPHLPAAFRQGLRDLGYVEGHDVVIEYRSAEGKLERFPALAAELVALKVAVIVAANTRATLAATGGNVTGVSSSAGPELVGKSLELLSQGVPGVKRVTALWHRDYPERTQSDFLREADVAARALGMHLQFVEARGGPENFARAFSEMTQARAEALTVLTSVLFASERRRLTDLAAKHRLPAVYPMRDFVDDGGLMSYGPAWADLYRRAAIYVDKILKGAKLADLPVEQPTKFELVINLKTAKALGLTIPQSLLQRADQVIE